MQVPRRQGAGITAGMGMGLSKEYSRTAARGHLLLARAPFSFGVKLTSVGGVPKLALSNGCGWTNDKEAARMSSINYAIA